MRKSIRITDSVTLEALHRLAEEDFRAPIREAAWLIQQEYRRRGGKPSDIVAEGILKAAAQVAQATETETIHSKPAEE